MIKVLLLILAVIVLVPALIAILLGVTAFLLKLALAVGVIALVGVGLRKAFSKTSRVRS